MAVGTFTGTFERVLVATFPIVVTKCLAEMTYGGEFCLGL